MKFTVATTALITEAAAATASFSSLLQNNGGNPHLPSMKHVSSTSIGIGAAHRQLEALQSIQSKKKQQEAHHDQIFQNAKTLLKNKQQTFPPFRASKLQEWMAQGLQQQLVELVKQEGDNFEECNPMTTQDADVGVLSCGQGRYCLESGLLAKAVRFESSAGGICIDMPSVSTIKALNGMGQRRQAQDVVVDEGDENFSFLQNMYDRCYGNFSFPGMLTCECTGIDLVAYRGSVSCQSDQPLCLDYEDSCESVVTFCYTTSYQLEVLAPYTLSYQSQTEITLPFTLRYEYGANYTGSPQPESCTVSFNDMQCNLCEFTRALVDGYSEPDDCIIVDCSNTEFGMNETVCRNTIVGAVVADYLLYDPLPCDNGCNLCGEGGYMTNFDQNVTFPTGEIYICRVVEFAALSGIFEDIEPDLCTILPPIVDVPCGCAGGENVGGPTAVGTMAPPEPTAAPIMVPTGSDAPGAAASTPTKMGMMVGTMAAAVMGWIMLA